MHIGPNEIVRVRLYDFNDRMICATGEQMLKLSEASDTAVALGILGTVLDAASLLAPGVGGALVEKGMSKAAAGALVGLTDVALREGVEVYRQNAAVGYGLQDKIDWGQIVFETLLQTVTVVFGPMLTDAAVNSVASKVAGTRSRAFLKIAVGSVIQGEIAVVHAEAQALFNELSGKKQDITVAGFLGELAAAFAQGALFHAVMTAASHHEEGVPGGTKEEGVQPSGARAASAPTHEEPSHTKTPTQVGEGPHEASHPTGKSTLKAKSGRVMEPESANSPKSLRPEDAIAESEVVDPGAKKPHKVIATKEGLGRCSGPPCPAISVIYATELAANPKLKARYERIRRIGQTDPRGASGEAALLVRDIEIARRQAGVMPGEHDEAPTNPDRGTTREQWKGAEGKRRWEAGGKRRWAESLDEKAVDDWGEGLEGKAAAPKVAGGPGSGYRFKEADGTTGKSVPHKRWVKLDMDPASNPQNPERADVAVPKRAGETGPEAVARVRTVIGKTISDIPELARIWSDVKAQILSKTPLTRENMPTLYKRAQQMLWDRVAGVTPQGSAARKALALADSKAAQAKLAEAGFGLRKGSKAPVLEGTDPRLRVEEMRISLDHKDEKAIDDNWQKALDAENLQLEIEMVNKERENTQQRHEELRSGAPPGSQ